MIDHPSKSETKREILILLIRAGANVRLVKHGDSLIKLYKKKEKIPEEIQYLIRSNGFDTKFEPGSKMFNAIKNSYYMDTFKLVKRVINLDTIVLELNKKCLLCFMIKFEII
jgi:hypothetical protein